MMKIRGAKCGTIFFLKEIFERKNLRSKFFMMKIRGAKCGTIFFLKEIFLGGNFGEPVLEEHILLGRKFCQQNFWRMFCE